MSFSTQVLNVYNEDDGMSADITSALSILNISCGGVNINGNSVTTSVELNAMKDSILGVGISSTFDTLVEIQNAFSNNPSAISDLIVSLSGEVTNRVAGDALLQVNIDSLTSTVNGLSSTGASLAYVNSAIAQEVTDRNGAITSNNTSLLGVGGLVTGAIGVETAARIAADTTLLSQINSNLSTLQGLITAEEGSRITGDNALQASVTSLGATTSTLTAGLSAEVNARISADAALQALINSLSTSSTTIQADLATETTARIAADSLLNSALAAEAATRSSADATLTGGLSTLNTNLTTEQSARIAADSALTASINSEVTRATAAEGLLTSNLATEVTARALVASNLAAEVTRATAAEGVLTSNLTTEVNRATAAEALIVTNTATNLNTERVRALAAESQLGTDITAAVLVERNRALAAEGFLAPKIMPAFTNYITIGDKAAIRFKPSSGAGVSNSLIFYARNLSSTVPFSSLTFNPTNGVVTGPTSHGWSSLAGVNGSLT
jgi:hypothetical protein